MGIGILTHGHMGWSCEDRIVRGTWPESLKLSNVDPTVINPS